MTVATTLSAEIAVIMADATTVVGAAITGLSYAIGRRSLPVQDSPPRVVWVRTEGAPGAPVKNAFPSRARSLLTRTLTLELHCWGADEDATDALVAAVLAACHRRWFGRWEYVGETWVDVPAQIELGEKSVVRITVDTAVLDRPMTSVTLTSASIDPTPAVASDGVLHVGEPS